MSLVGELLRGSRTDVFRIRDGMDDEQLGKLDLRLVQSYKRTENTIEVKFADIAKLCELAAAERSAVTAGSGASDAALGRLRELAGICEAAAELDEDKGSDMSAE